MAELLADCDLLITTGGVSVGDKDIFHQALPLLGAERVFWKVNLKPGTPAMFSRYGGKPILSLSGNPFAAFTTFELLARPLLAALSGEPHLLPQQRQALLTTRYGKPSPRRRFLRGRYEEGRVELPEGHSSGQLASLLGCNCLVELPAGLTRRKPDRPYRSGCCNGYTGDRTGRPYKTDAAEAAFTAARRPIGGSHGTSVQSF